MIMRTLLLISLVATFLHWVNGLPPPSTLDYTEYHKTIRHALDTSSRTGLIKPITATSTSLDCHLPESSIMITLSNSYTSELIALQHKAMDVWGMKECLESRFITVCLDEACMKICESNSIKNCLHMPIVTVDSDFMAGSFRFLMVLKHLLVFEALKLVEKVFFFDSDVLLFQNPWIDTQYKRDNDGNIDIAAPIPDIMWQADTIYELGCQGNVNGGQMYFRNSTEMQEFYYYFLTFEDKMLGDPQKTWEQDWDQFYVQKGVDAVGLQTCTFLYTKFASHCFPVKGVHNVGPFNATAPLNNLIGYHSNCAGHMAGKTAKNIEVLNGVLQKKDSNKLIDFV